MPITKTDTPSQIGLVIKARLKALGKPQKLLAKDLEQSAAAVSKWRHGSNPSREMISKMRAILQIDGDTLLDACDNKLSQEQINRLDNPYARSALEPPPQAQEKTEPYKVVLSHVNETLLQIYATASKLPYAQQKLILETARAMLGEPVDAQQFAVKK